MANGDAAAPGTWRGVIEREETDNETATSACCPKLGQWPVQLPPGAPHRTVFPERGQPGGC